MIPSKDTLKLLLLSVVQKCYMNLEGSHILKVKILMCLLNVINWDTKLQPHLTAFIWYKDDLSKLIKTKVTSTLVNHRGGETEEKLQNVVLLQLVDII